MRRSAGRWVLPSTREVRRWLEKDCTLSASEQNGKGIFLNYQSIRRPQVQSRAKEVIGQLVKSTYCSVRRQEARFPQAAHQCL